MAEPIAFLTGKHVSGASVTVITPGTLPSAMTAAELAAKTRRWALSLAASPAIMPANPYRSSVNVDNVNGGVDARMYIHNGTEACPNDTTTIVFTIPAGTGQIFTTAKHDIGYGNMSVSIASDSATETIVTEISNE